MFGWKLCGWSILAAALLTLASCRPTTDVGAEPTPPMPATAWVVVSWQSGFGFLVDRTDRLLVTASQTVGAQQDVEVVFPVIEDGKEKVRRDYYQTKAARVKGHVLTDPVQALVLIQLASVPEGFPELKLAAANPTKDTPVHLVVDTGLKSTLWGAKSATVLGLIDDSVPVANGERASVRIMELDLDGKFAKGSGGGPLANDAGEVVGVTAPMAVKSHMAGIAVADVRKTLTLGYRRLASAAIENLEYVQAIAYCDKALALTADDALTYNERGAALSHLNKLDDAVVDYTKALKYNPQLPKVYRNRAKAYFSLGKYDLAVADCTEAINLDNNYIQAYETRSEAYTKLKKLDLARQDDEFAAELRKRAANR